MDALAPPIKAALALALYATLCVAAAAGDISVEVTRDSDETQMHALPGMTKLPLLAVPDRNDTQRVAEASSSGDADGDGVPDDEDAFPENPGEFADSNGNETGNWQDPDEDGDGTPDIDDAYPMDPARTDYTLFRESEPNDELPSSQHLPDSAHRFQLAGEITESDPVDFYRLPFTPEPGVSAAFTVRLEANSGSPAPRIQLLDSSGQDISLLALERAGPLLSGVLPYVGDDVVQGILIHPDDLVHPELILDQAFLAIGRDQWSETGSAAYTVTVYVDENADGIDDARNLALGIPNASDADDDGLSNGTEYFVRDTADLRRGDFDSDGVPNWLDQDSDGDGLPDAAESSGDGIPKFFKLATIPAAIDIDGDGLANFADPDSDGNGIGDASEAGPDVQAPLDSDHDGLPDFIDLDDDGDGVRDVLDDNRLSPLRFASAQPLADFVVTTFVAAELTDGTRVKDRARVGEILHVEGRNFSSSVDDTIVVFDRAGASPGEMARLGPLNVRPSEISENDLRVRVPEGAGNEFFVATGGVRSGDFSLKHIGPEAPVLETLSSSVATPGDVITISGQNFNDSTQIKFGTFTADPEFLSATEVRVQVPSEAITGTVAATNGDAISNELQLKVARGVTVKIIGIDTDVTQDSLSLKAGLVGDPVLYSNSSVRVLVDRTRPDTIDVLLPPGEQGERAVYRTAFVLPSQDTVTMGVAEMATAMVMQTAMTLVNVPPDQLVEAKSRVDALLEVTNMGLILSQKLADDPYFLNTTDEPFDQSFANALGAAVTELQSLAESPSASLANFSAESAASQAMDDEDIPGGLPPEAQVRPPRDVYNMVMRPEVQPDSGNASVRNHTSLYYSARMVDRRNDKHYVQHISSGIDADIGPPRHAVLTGGSASVLDFASPTFRDADIELLTPGIKPSIVAGNSELPEFDGAAQVRSHLLLRTVASQIVEPLTLHFLTGRETYQILIANLDTTMSAIEGAYSSGQPLEGLRLLLEFIWNDFRNLGPISSVLVEKATGEAASGVMGAQLKRMAKVINLLRGLDPLAAGVELLHTPERLTYTITFPLHLSGIPRREIDIMTTPFTGQAFSPVIDEHGGADYPIFKIDVDEGAQGSKNFTITPDIVEYNGRKVYIFSSSNFSWFDLINFFDPPADIYIEVDHDGEQSNMLHYRRVYYQCSDDQGEQHLVWDILPEGFPLVPRLGRGIPCVLTEVFYQ